MRLCLVLFDSHRSSFCCARLRMFVFVTHGELGLGQIIQPDNILILSSHLIFRIFWLICCSFLLCTSWLIAAKTQTTSRIDFHNFELIVHYVFIGIWSFEYALVNFLVHISIDIISIISRPHGTRYLVISTNRFSIRILIWVSLRFQ